MDSDRAVRRDWVAHDRERDVNNEMARYFRVSEVDPDTFERIAGEMLPDDCQEARVLDDDGSLYIAVDESEVDSIHFALSVLDNESEVKK